MQLIHITNTPEEDGADDVDDAGNPQVEDMFFFVPSLDGRGDGSKRRRKFEEPISCGGVPGSIPTGDLDPTDSEDEDQTNADPTGGLPNDDKDSDLESDESGDGGGRKPPSPEKPASDPPRNTDLLENAHPLPQDPEAPPDAPKKPRRRRMRRRVPLPVEPPPATGDDEGTQPAPGPCGEEGGVLEDLSSNGKGAEAAGGTLQPSEADRAATIPKS